MDYTTAKKLKEVGFPQKSGVDYKSVLYIDPDGQLNEWGETIHIEAVYLPTLSELIEACGGDYHDFHLKWRSGFWWAVCSIGESPDLDWCQGSTPEEAVANLWLALQESSKM